MKKFTTTTLAIAAAAALAGCSSFNMGAACYVPHGVTGQCTAMTVEPGTTPAAPIEPASKKKI